ncbi:hypothetical protein P3102_08815 [Amycolatopsis sp. QT-25]|nr:hypothetical protein [Amycolatopsis sp. QT-25]WET81306.1 hypothetical protein P3102_08815 [Amycolatopsis sp. QT-25]
MAIDLGNACSEPSATKAVRALPPMGGSREATADSTGTASLRR